MKTGQLRRSRAGGRAVKPSAVAEYHAIFSNNSFKGETYLLKLKRNDILYLGIPIARTRYSNGEDDTFCFSIIEPDSESGVFEVPFREIEFAVKKTD